MEEHEFKYQIANLLNGRNVDKKIATTL